MSEIDANAPATMGDLLLVVLKVEELRSELKAREVEFGNVIALSKIQDAQIDAAFEAVSEQTIRIDALWDDVKKLRDELMGSGS